jgi:hypothetical protein
MIARFATVLAVLGGAVLAQAGACRDTVYLQGLTRTAKTFRYTSSSADSNATTEAMLTSSGSALDSILPVPVPTAFSSYVDSLSLPLAFAANCPGDSVSSVLLWRAVDSAGSGGRIRLGAQRTEALQARAFFDTTYFLVPGGDTIKLSQYWPVGHAGHADSLYQIGTLFGDDSLRGGFLETRALLYKGNSINMLRYPMAATLPGAGLTAMQKEQIGAYQAYADSVKSGRYDSLVIASWGYASVYGSAARSYSSGSSTAIASRTAASSAALKVSYDGTAWTASAAKASVGFVRGLDGRQVRAFPAASSFTWDGSSASGQRLSRGVYVLGFEGQGAKAVVLP